LLHFDIERGDFRRVELDPLFLDCIRTDAQHPMKVFIQMNGDCNGTFVEVGTTGFDVHELNSGKSDAAFSYRVLANRKDTDFIRLPKAPALTPLERALHVVPGDGE